MRRRAPAPEPVAASAEWSRRAASFAALLSVFAVVLGRSGVVGGWGGVAVLGAALIFALAAIGLAARAAVVIWRQGWRGAGRALLGCLLAGLVLAYPTYLAIQAARLPMLDDVSTDLVALPAFSASAAARSARNGFVHEEPSAQTREEQRRAYPGVAPVILDAEPDEAYGLVLKIIAARRWHVIDAVPPRGRLGVGHIDAVARTPIMGFPADVTFRIRSQSGQTRVDLRSASRLERHDVGSNAARIEAFADDLQNEE